MDATTGERSSMTFDRNIIGRTTIGTSPLMEKVKSTASKPDQGQLGRMVVGCTTGSNKLGRWKKNGSVRGGSTCDLTAELTTNQMTAAEALLSRAINDNGGGGEERDATQAALDKLRRMAEADEPQQWIQTTQASLIFSVVIVVNVFLLGVQADLPAEVTDFGDAKYVAWFIIESLFNLIFITEIALRLRCEGISFLTKGANLFDLAIVVLSVVDTWIVGFVGALAGESLRFVTVFRVLRLLRLLRIFRLFRFFDTLWTVVNSLLQAVSALGWILVIAFFLCYTVAVIIRLTLGVSMHHKLEGEALEVAKERWGSVLRSVFTLFVCMTGDEWYEITIDATRAEEWMYIIFVPFMCLAHLMLINLFIGIMCERVHQEHCDAEKLKSQQADEDTVLSLASIFVLIDDDDSGSICWDELVMALTCEKFKEKFEALGMHQTSNSNALYRFFDASQDGIISFPEFVTGCMALKHSDIDSKLWFLQDDLHHYGERLLSAAGMGGLPYEAAQPGTPTLDRNGQVQVAEEKLREETPHLAVIGRMIDEKLKETRQLLRQELLEDISRLLDAQSGAPDRRNRDNTQAEAASDESADDAGVDPCSLKEKKCMKAPSKDCGVQESKEAGVTKAAQKLPPTQNGSKAAPTAKRTSKGIQQPLKSDIQNLELPEDMDSPRPGQPPLASAPSGPGPPPTGNAVRDDDTQSAAIKPRKLDRRRPPGRK